MRSLEEAEKEGLVHVVGDRAAVSSFFDAFPADVVES
jgi:hypothetical protein